MWLSGQAPQRRWQPTLAKWVTTQAAAAPPLMRQMVAASSGPVCESARHYSATGERVPRGFCQRYPIYWYGGKIPRDP